MNGMADAVLTGQYISFLSHTSSKSTPWICGEAKKREATAYSGDLNHALSQRNGSNVEGQSEGYLWMITTEGKHDAGKSWGAKFFGGVLATVFCVVIAQTRLPTQRRVRSRRKLKTLPRLLLLSLLKAI